MKNHFVMAQVAAFVFSACFLLTATTRGDPMLALEVAVASVVALWAALVAWNVVRAWILRRRLEDGSRSIVVAGIACRLVASDRADAFSIGVRPTIFLSARAVQALDRQQLRAVVLHEDHHRRSRAPLRAAALDAWLVIGGRWQMLRTPLVLRLAALEAAADRYALERGATPEALASALLRMDRSSTAPSFTGQAEHRIDQLLAASRGAPMIERSHLPIEWLPALVLVAMALGCRLAGTGSVI